MSAMPATTTRLAIVGIDRATGTLVASFLDGHRVDELQITNAIASDVGKVVTVERTGASECEIVRENK